MKHLTESLAIPISDSDMEMIRKMFEDSPVLMCLLSGPDHKVIYVNPKLRELHDNRPIKYGEPAIEIWPELQKQGKGKRDIFGWMDNVYKTGEAVIINENKVYIDRTNSGKLERAYFNFAYQPLKDDEGNVHSLFLTGQEVTERVKIRKEKDRAEKRFQIALEGAKLGFFEVDAKGKSFKFLSDHAKELLGYSTDDHVTYQDYYDSIHPEDIEKVNETVQLAVEEDVLYELQCRILWPDGSLHWLLVRGYVITDDNGVPERRIGIAIDITNQKETEEKLRKALKVRDDFLSVASHELQTPVTSLKTRLDLFELQLRKEEHHEHADEAAILNRQVQQLENLTKKLLDISRIKEERLKLEKEEFILNNLIDETITTFSHLSDHQFKIQGNAGVKVYADKYRIGQVLTNLLENAIKYSPHAANIIIDICEEEESVSVSVIDFGIGISDEEKTKVFKRFFRGEERGKQTYPGIGIGLYIAAQIVDRHDGTITVKDNKEGGSVFTFKIPR